MQRSFSDVGVIIARNHEEAFLSYPSLLLQQYLSSAFLALDSIISHLLIMKPDKAHDCHVLRFPCKSLIQCILHIVFKATVEKTKYIKME